MVDKDSSYVKNTVLHQLNTVFDLLMKHPNVLYDAASKKPGPGQATGVSTVLGAPIDSKTAQNLRLSAKVEPEMELRKKLKQVLRDAGRDPELVNQYKNMPQLQEFAKKLEIELKRPMPQTPKNTAR